MARRPCDVLREERRRSLFRTVARREHMSKTAVVFALSCSALIFGCAADQPSDSTDDNQEIIDNLVQAGFPKTDIQVFDGKVYVGLDAEVSLQASREMLASPDGLEQYHTTKIGRASCRERV